MSIERRAELGRVTLPCGYCGTVNTFTAGYEYGYCGLLCEQAARLQVALRDSVRQLRADMDVIDSMPYAGEDPYPYESAKGDYIRRWVSGILAEAVATHAAVMVSLYPYHS